MGPAELVLQFILLSSALYFTILIAYRRPDSFWDWKVAVTALPVLMLDIFVAPNLIAPMILALYTENFVDKKVADSIILKSKFDKFARAAKLLHAMRSRARILQAGKRRLSTAAPYKPPSYDEIMATADGEKRKKALELKEAFDNFDADKSDSLDVKELTPLMGSLGISLDSSEVQQLVDELDLDKSGTVSFAEFADRMLQEEEEGLPPQDVAKSIFEMLDTDKSGSLTMSELRTAFNNLHTGLSSDDITLIINELDDDDTGDVNEEEFVNAMEKILGGE